MERPFDSAAVSYGSDFSQVSYGNDSAAVSYGSDFSQDSFGPLKEMILLYRLGVP